MIDFHYVLQVISINTIIWIEERQFSSIHSRRILI